MGIQKTIPNHKDTSVMTNFLEMEIAMGVLEYTVRIEILRNLFLRLSSSQGSLVTYIKKYSASSRLFHSKSRSFNSNNSKKLSPEVLLPLYLE
jgi:hypothetical protein